MASQPETQAMDSILFRAWYPQIIYNHHQTGPIGTVIFAPPFRDPFNYNYDPLVPMELDLVGAAMHSRFVAEGKAGATMRSGSGYSTWWNGGLRTTVRLNFVNGAGETSGFRFIGSEGILTIGNGVNLRRTPRETEPGYTLDSFDRATREKILAEYRQKYPEQRAMADSLRPNGEDQYAPPRGYNDHLDHHRNFLAAVRSRKAVTEDALFGLRAAGPALLSNRSYFEGKILGWNPETCQEA